MCLRHLTSASMAYRQEHCRRWSHDFYSQEMLGPYGKWGSVHRYLAPTANNLIIRIPGNLRDTCIAKSSQVFLGMRTQSSYLNLVAFQPVYIQVTKVDPLQAPPMIAGLLRTNLTLTFFPQSPILLTTHSPFRNYRV